MALQAVRRIGAVFAIEREINGRAAEVRLDRRQAASRPLVDDFEAWMRAERAKHSRHVGMAKATAYMLKRWPGFTRFLDDGRICLCNNAGDRALKCVAVGRRNWTFAGSDRGDERAAAVYALVETAKRNDVDPEARLADVLARVNGHPVSRLAELLPWHWRPEPEAADAA